MSRIAGKDGAVYLNLTGIAVVKIGDVYDWEYTTEVVLYPADIKMDLNARFASSHGAGTFTAKRRLNTAAAFTELATGALLDFRLDLIDANAAFVQITGSGYIDSASLSAPRGAVDDTISLTIDGGAVITSPGAN